MTQDQIREHIKSIVDNSPPLTDQQRARLTELLRPVPAADRRAT